MSSPEEAAAVSAAAPDDADDLRGVHFKRLLRKPLTLALIALATIAAGVGVTVLIEPFIGGAAAVVALLAGIVVVLAIADSKAADDFFQAYAASHGLTLGGHGPLPEATPLLRKGNDRYAQRTLSGALADGVDGTLAIYTYEEHYNGKTNQTDYYPYTLALVEVPECAALVPELYCQRKFGLRALEKFEDTFRGSKERVRLESEGLDDKYEIFAGKGQDAVWLRRLFAPTFIVWLTDSAPEKFAFELVGGTLCCYVNGHREDAADLEAIAAAGAEVAKRLREESAVGSA